MLDLCRRHLLTVITVLTVLCGLAHQVEGRFAMHDHCGQVDACCHHQEDESPAPDHSGKACDHALCAHAITALVESPAPVLFRTWIPVASTPDFFLHPPVVEPAEIEHPPQLA